MSIAADPYRDGYGLALAWLDDDMECVAELLAPYALRDAELHLLVGVLDLLRLHAEPAALRSLLYGIALAGAGRRPDSPAT